MMKQIQNILDNELLPKAKIDIYVAAQFVNVFKISFLIYVISNKIVIVYIFLLFVSNVP